MPFLELTEDQLILQKAIRDFAQREIKPLVTELDQAPKEKVNWDIIRKAGELGLSSGFLPRKYGGSLGGISACVVVEELAAVDAGVCILLTSSGLGIAPVAIAGGKTLADKLFPQIVEAERAGKPIFWAYAITEPEAGSDVEDEKGSRTAKLVTTAKREGDSYIINGTKVFITLGSIAKWVSVFATMDLKAGVDAWTCFVVPTDTPGFSVDRTEDKMGQRACPTCTISFNNVKIPAEYRVGEEGKGWTLNRQSLAVTRPGVGATGVGCARGAYEIALSYAAERYQGGRRIIEHQMIQGMLADMVIQIEAARLLCYQAASQRPASLKLSSAAKVFGTDMAVKVATDAIQVLGGYGYMKDYGVEKYLRDVRVTQIYEGTNQINRIAIMEGVMEEMGYRG